MRQRFWMWRFVSSSTDWTTPVKDWTFPLKFNPLIVMTVRLI
jgi:hypothetical protein